MVKGLLTKRDFYHRLGVKKLANNEKSSFGKRDFSLSKSIRILPNFWGYLKDGVGEYA